MALGEGWRTLNSAASLGTGCRELPCASRGPLGISGGEKTGSSPTASDRGCLNSHLVVLLPDRIADAAAVAHIKTLSHTSIPLKPSLGSTGATFEWRRCSRVENHTQTTVEAMIRLLSLWSAKSRRRPGPQGHETAVPVSAGGWPVGTSHRVSTIQGPKDEAHVIPVHVVLAT